MTINRAWRLNPVKKKNKNIVPVVPKVMIGLKNWISPLCFKVFFHKKKVLNSNFWLNGVEGILETFLILIWPFDRENCSLEICARPRRAALFHSGVRRIFLRAPKIGQMSSNHPKMGQDRGNRPRWVECWRLFLVLKRLNWKSLSRDLSKFQHSAATAEFRKSQFSGLQSL